MISRVRLHLAEVIADTPAFNKETCKLDVTTSLYLGDILYWFDKAVWLTMQEARSASTVFSDMVDHGHIVDLISKCP